MNPLILDLNPSFKSPIVVALDFNDESSALSLIKYLDPSLCKLKVGKELFTATGPQFIEKLVISGYDVFLDLKFHDIPNTVHKACKVAANLGVWMLNVHASGGEKMLMAARDAIEESLHKPLLIGVTILTSMNEADMQKIGVTTGINSQIKRLAQLSYSCGLDGVVCSAIEAKAIKEYTHANFITVTPGIRLPSNKLDDQEQIMTPQDALNNLADYLVIGRPITQALQPRETLLNILSELKKTKSTDC